MRRSPPARESPVSTPAAAAPARDGCGGAGKMLKAAARSRKHLEGPLRKYTNLLHGWQSRFFVLDPDSGQLWYYLSAATRGQQAPRGALCVVGARVSSSPEHPFMFTVQSSAGDVYKLRASDASEREVWMTQLQLCSRRRSDSTSKEVSPGQAQKTPHTPLELQSRRGPVPGDEDLLFYKTPSTLSCLGQCLNLFHQNLHWTRSPTQNHLQSLEPDTLPDRAPSLGQPRPTAALNHVEPGGVIQAKRSPAHRAGSDLSYHHNQGPTRAGSDLSYHHNQGPTRAGSDFSYHHNQGPTRAGSDLSYHHNQGPTRAGSDLSYHPNQGHTRADSAGCSGPCSEKPHINSTAPPASKLQPLRTPAHSTEEADVDDEVTDAEDHEEEEELGVLDEQRSVLIHLLSQLKLGMDLTRVVLPTFILERRSLLEMYANFLSHPDMFLRITCGPGPEERMVRVLEYYLTSFHEGRRGAVAKKPYNPVLGETFRCSWSVPPRQPPAPGQSAGGTGGAADCYRVHFVAEQVSHHPPVSAFYCECPERRVCVNAHVWTKSKFMGVSVGVSMVGEGALHLLEHGERYVFTLPCAYARSVLTVPWVELGGKVSISCAQSGLSASVTFHTKPFYGGKIHRVTAEVKHNQTGALVCRAQGEWNGVLEFTYSDGETRTMDTRRLPVTRKRLRALDQQGPQESRRLWQHVTEALKAGNMEEATEHKRHLEERQRNEQRQRAATNIPWTPKHFNKQGDGWVYNRPLWETH